MEQNNTKKQMILEAIDQLNDIFLDMMEECWEEEQRWNQVSEIRTHVLIARVKFASLP